MAEESPAGKVAAVPATVVRVKGLRHNGMPTVQAIPPAGSVEWSRAMLICIPALSWPKETSHWP